MGKKDNTGKEIEFVGIVLFALIFAAGIIAGIRFITSGDMPKGIIYIAGGFLTGYISSLFIRGFGRLVNNSERSRELLIELRNEISNKIDN